MKNIFHTKVAFAVLLLLAALSPAYTELVGSQTYGYSLDMPEGFVLVDSTANGRGYQFQNILFPVHMIVRVYSAEEFDTTEKAMNSTLVKLSATAETSSVEWRNTDTVLSQFQMVLGGERYGGWGVCAALPEAKGYIAVLAYAATSDGRGGEPSRIYEPLILSCVDAVYIDRGSFLGCGPVTAFAFPPSTERTVELDIGGTKVSTVLSSDDEEANEFVITREFQVMRLFADTDYWLPAWQRYYRQIYRDAYGRLKRPAFDIYAALYQNARRQSPDAPEATMAQWLLSWTQGFDYQRDFQNSDFASIPAALFGASGSDCDSRAMLLAILLRHMNMQTAMFVSPVYSHALLGVALDLPGAKIAADGTTYLLGETTAPVQIGLVAEDMAVTENWIPILFP